MGCSVRLQQIVGKGKRGAAEYIKACRSPEILNEVLDGILSNEVNIDDSESIDWIRWLMAGGYTPENFTEIVKKYNNATACGLLWSEQSIAYRCRTCSLTRCMSLCSDCFLNGHHEGHDYNMFRSETGGRCDCGDSSVMQSSGFCNDHCSVSTSENVVPPPDLLFVAELMAPRLFCRLILHLRSYKYSPVDGTVKKSDFGAENFLSMLCQLSEMGAAMMKILTSALISTDAYRKLTQCWSRDGSANASYMNSCEQLYKKALKLFQNSDPSPEFNNCPGLRTELEHITFLQELVFWAVYYEFPQKLINFLLIMLPDTKYKVALTEAFVLHYNCITMILEKTSDPNGLSKRVANVSVQWLSNKDLAVRMTKDLNLLEVMIISVKNMISRILVPVSSNGAEAHSLDKRLVVNCDSSIISQCRYWLFISDLNTVLSYDSVALKFMSDDFLPKIWFSFVSYFQGMNVNKRELKEHVESGQDTATVFLAELWASSYPILPLFLHLKDESTIHLTKKMILHCLMTLEEWLDSANVSETCEHEELSFHIPLHRCLAMFIRQAVNVQHIPLAEVLPQNDRIFSILLHPLRIQVGFYEIMNGMWVRNGLHIKNQALAYTENDFCSSMVDADLYLLQILATEVPSSLFMSTVIEKFRIQNWLRIDCNESSSTEEKPENNIQIVESFLIFLTILCNNRRNLNESYFNINRLEVVTLLAVADRTHSEIMELMPEHADKQKTLDLDIILEQVADYKPPNFKSGGNMQQGLYVLKESVWKELFDPVHVLLRTGISKIDFQCAMDRFTTYVTRSKQPSAIVTPWPPFRIPEVCDSSYIDPRHILDSNLFHAVIWIILYKYMHEKVVTERVLSLTVHLLEMALSVTAAETTNTARENDWINITIEKPDSWFSSNKLLRNVKTMIRDITSSSLPGFALKNVNESIISLLLKIHASFSGFRDSINLQNVSKLNERIGDGKSFIEKVLIRIVTASEACRNEVLSSKGKLLPKQCVDENDVREKKQKAEERRRKIMESFAKQQEKFAKENQKILEFANKDEMDWQRTDKIQTEDELEQKEYYCGICKKLIPSTNDNPILLVVHVQTTSVLGCKQEYLGDANGCTLSEYYMERMIRLSEEFEKFSWENSVNIGWKNGILIQTCGHYFDSNCLLISNEVGRDYLCPVCRQLANGFLPILPNAINTSLVIEPHDLMQSMFDITSYSSGLIQNEEIGSLLTHVTLISIENMKHCANFDPSLSRLPLNSLLFSTSVARTNLEIEIMLRGGSLVKKPIPSAKENITAVALKKSCIKPLLNVLAAPTSKLDREYAKYTWLQLTSTLKVKVANSERKCVPLLMRDPVTLLMQFILILPRNLNKAHFTSVVKFLYNLLFFQIAIQLSCQLNENERNYFCLGNVSVGKLNLHGIMKFIIGWFDKIQFYAGQPGGGTSFQKNIKKALERKIQSLCLPFLRIAALLRFHIFAHELPNVFAEENEFESLTSYLELIRDDCDKIDQSSVTIVTLLNDKLDFVECWFEELSAFTSLQKMFSRNFLSRMHVEWMQPKLLQLPTLYDDVLKCYQGKVCNSCKQACEKSSICLVCGTLVCLEEECCKREDVYEAVRHAVDCGATTGIFLTVSSSSVVIIRGYKACKWGSLYLDGYGEEDLYLKRGRPLFLSAERYQLLEQQWLTHSFNNTGSDWYLHNNQL